MIKEIEKIESGWSGRPSRAVYVASTAHSGVYRRQTLAALGDRGPLFVCALWRTPLDVPSLDATMYEAVRSESEEGHVEPKTKRSRRILVLPPVAVRHLREHHDRQQGERNVDAAKGNELDLVVTTKEGKPIDGTVCPTSSTGS
jgi:hypothetical protein